MRHYRWMIRRDMIEVLEIERQCFGFPWSEEHFVYCLQQRNTIGMVVEVDKRVRAFVIYELHPSRIEVLNLAVERHHQRIGLGAMLIDKLKLKLNPNPNRRGELAVNVAEFNTPAQLFLKSQGLSCIRIDKNAWITPDIDAYRFVYSARPKQKSVPVDDLRIGHVYEVSLRTGEVVVGEFLGFVRHRKGMPFRIRLAGQARRSRIAVALITLIRELKKQDA